MDGFGGPMHFHWQLNPPWHLLHPPEIQDHPLAPPPQPQVQYVSPGASLRMLGGAFLPPLAAPEAPFPLPRNSLQPTDIASPENPPLGHLPHPPLQHPQARPVGGRGMRPNHGDYVHPSSKDPIVIDSDSDNDTLFPGRRIPRNRSGHSIGHPDTIGHREPIQPPGQPGPTVPVEPQSLQSPNSVSEIDLEDLYKLRLAAVMEVFPDISRDYVRRLWDQSRERGVQSSNITADQFISQIIDAGNYPKEVDKIKERKRKRAMYVDSDEEEAAEYKDLAGLPDKYQLAAQLLLQNEFPYIPLPYIVTQLKEHGRLFKTFFILEDAERTYPNPRFTYKRLKKPRRPTKFLDNRIAASLDRGMPEPRGYGLESLRRELAAAKRQSKKKEDIRITKEADKKADEAEDQKQIAAHAVAPCGLCYDDEIPLRKIAECRNGHMICIDCLRNHGNNAIGENKGYLVCATDENCKASYIRKYLERALGEKAFGRLEFLDQQADLKAAGIDDLAECPFCDFKAIMAQTKDVNKEFRCFNPECEKVSCRLCNKVSHIPLSCEEAKAEEGIDERHLIEEAMTAAVMRTCPGCKTPVMKEYGCNLMVCKVEGCRTAMCDHCNKKLHGPSDYGHFGGPGVSLNGRQKCPLYENLEHRNAAAAAAAETAMLAKLKKDNPDLSEDQLKVTAKMKSQESAPRFDFSGAPGRGQLGPAGANRWGAFDLLRDMEADGALVQRPPMLHAGNFFDDHGPYNNHGPMGAEPLQHHGVLPYVQYQQRQQGLRHVQQEVSNADHQVAAAAATEAQIRQQMADLTRQIHAGHGQAGGRAYDGPNAPPRPPSPRPPLRPRRPPAYALDDGLGEIEIDGWPDDQGGYYDEDDDVEPFRPHVRIRPDAGQGRGPRRYY